MIGLESFRENIEKKRIGSIEYSVLTKNEIVNQSEVALTQKNYYVQMSQIPEDFGPLDLRMGPPIKEQVCRTCYQEIETCPGHFGYIRIALPIFHLGYFTEIINILQSICKKCGEVRLPPEQKEQFRYMMERAIKEGNYQKRAELYKALRAECKKIQNVKCKQCFFNNGKLKKLQKLPTMISYQNENTFTDSLGRFKNEPQQFQKQVNELKESGKLKDLLQFFSPLKCLNLFMKIKEEDVCLFNMDVNKIHPMDLIVTHIIAPPNCIRPTVKEGDAGLRHDDLTGKIKDFLDRNDKIQKMIQSGEEVYQINQEWYMLQCSYSQYLNSECPNLPVRDLNKKSKSDLRSLAQRLKGKKGRFRGNLSGKRSNFTGRTVISPDPNIKIDQVIIPEFMARILTYPERVTEHNIEKLRKLVINGPEKYPGATQIIKQNGDKFSLAVINRRKQADALKYGDIIERHIQNNEIVLFNRQPSLHRISIMAFKTIIHKWHTIRFNECCCAPFNADFDGDEMNIHVPQTLEARAEAQYLLDVKENLITPKNGELIISLVQDFLTAAYLLTHKDMYLDRSQFAQACCYFSDANEKIEIPPPTILVPVELWTGKQLVSSLLCPNRKNKVIVNLSLKEKCYDSKADQYVLCPKDGQVLIQQSELLSGNIGKTTLGGGNKNGLFYRLLRDNSVVASGEVMSRFAKISGRWLSSYGMTIGISDVTPSPKLNQINEQKKDDAILQCVVMGKNFIIETKNWDRQNMREKKAMVEGQISKTLNQVREDIGNNCLIELPHNNGPLIMATCGSKGSATNLSQMIGCVGQQIISGKRVPNGFSGRTLPHFIRNEIIPHPEAMGFVRNSFFSGLSPPEFFFHTMAGRESLVDTAVKTADTGYMSRRMVHFLEDVTVAYDLSVRACDTKDIIQFRYGGDGLCPWVSEEKVSDKSPPIDFKQMVKFIKTMVPRNYRTEQILTPYETAKIILIEIQIFNKKMDFVPKLNDNSVQIKNKLNTNEINYKEPNDEEIQNFLSEKYIDTKQNQIKEPIDYFLDFVKEFFQQQLILQIKGRRNFGMKECKTKEESDLYGNQSNYFLDSLFSITKRQLLAFFQLLQNKYPAMLVQVGEPIGAVSATSISEPATQMTLKSFHFAGVASMNITQGVPRMKEIIDAAKKIKAPVIDVKLKSQFLNSEIIYKKVRSKIEKTVLDEIVEYYKEVYSPKDCYLLIKLDQTKLSYLRGIDIHIKNSNIIEGILKLYRIDIKREQIEIIQEQGKKVAQYLKILPYAELTKAQKRYQSQKSKRNVFFLLQNWKKVLPTAVVYGMDQVKSVTISKDRKNQNSPYTYNLFIEGNVFKKVLGIDEVDFQNTSTVDIHEILEVLGVEAARKSIIQELTKTLKSHSLNVDKRHLILVADQLTSKGRLHGSTRQGIPYLKNSTLMMASFEKTTEILYNAALQGKKDTLEGVSERIIIGQHIPMGTGMFDVCYNTQNNNQNQNISTQICNIKEQKGLFD